MFGVSRRLGSLLMGAAISAIGAATLFIFDFWELWNQASTALPIVLSFFSLFLILGIRQVLKEMEAAKFLIEPNWQESQQAVWHHTVNKGVEFFELQTAIKIRFNNGDAVPHVVKTASLLLLRPWWHWWSRKLAYSYYVTRYPQNSSAITERFDSSGPGITVQPHSMSEYMYFRFFTGLPLGVSALKCHIAKVKFEIMGRREKFLVMSVHCPRPHEHIRYDSDARPLVPDKAETQNEPSG